MKITGMKVMIFCCIGSVTVVGIFLNEEHRHAHQDWQDVVRVLRRQVMDPQGERRVAQLDRTHQHVVQRRRSASE